jgi:hypothetical protein
MKQTQVKYQALWNSKLFFAFFKLTKLALYVAVLYFAYLGFTSTVGF